MKRALFRMLRRWLPSRTVAWLTRHRRNRYTGPYPSWAEARALSTGYAAPDILERVTAATRMVVAGNAAFERDSVTFLEPAPDPIVLAALSRLHQANRTLRVLDFGGALGGTYHQHRRFLPEAMDISWQVVEQPHYVDSGLAEFQTAELHFHRSISAAGAGGPPHLVLVSSVLQYLEDPWATLRELYGLSAQSWIISRTPFHAGERDLAMIQHVPARIYRANYPVWILAEERFQSCAAKHGLELTWHPAPEGMIRESGLSFAYRSAELHCL